MIEPLNRKFYRIIEEMIKNASHAHTTIDENNVYQEGDPRNKLLMREIIDELMLPGSQLIGFENLVKLYELAKQGKKCLMLMEHYSNFDIPCFYTLMWRKGEIGKKVADAIVSVAGMKLNEESALVRSFTEIFTRVVIFPKSGLKDIQDTEELRKAVERRKRINLAALKKLFELRNSGRLILVFPTGTRYRPWNPSTGRGLKEIDSYLKSYDYMVLIAINGNTLKPNPNGNMDEDLPERDVMIYTISDVYSCKEYRKKVISSIPAGKTIDVKQYIADTIMRNLKDLHKNTEIKRKKLLEKLEEQDRKNA